MRAFQVVFKSGTAVTLYGETKDQALESIWEGADVDCVVDATEMMKREKEFKRKHEELLTSLSVLNAIQELKAKKAAFSHADEQNLIPKQPGQSGLVQL